MIQIYSTDEERTEVLKDKILTVTPWNKKSEMKLLDPDMSIRRAIIQHARNMNLMGSIMRLEGMDIMPAFSSKSVDESLYRTVQRKGDIQDLAKLFTVLNEVAENAVLLEVEEYRHKQRSTAKYIGEMRQYVSAFYDKSIFYPVKITVAQKKVKNEAQVYMVVTVGKLEMKNLFEKEREALPNAGVTSNKHSVVGESLPDGTASFSISIPQLVKKFNKKEGILLKNFPDLMLTEQQRQVKAKIIERDMQKDQKPKRSAIRR